MSKENEKMEQAMNLLKEENTKERLSDLMEILNHSIVYVPAVLPPDTPPELIKQIASGTGEQKIPEGLSPRPAMLENTDGEKFLPVFSTREKAKERNMAPLILGLEFEQCMNLVTRQEQLCGVVLNAFEQNITLNKKKQEPTEEQQVTLTEEQLHFVLRQQVEVTALPGAFFGNPEEMVERIRRNAGECILSFYEELYPEQVVCPYTEEDFDAMVLNVRDDLTVIRILMPAGKRSAGICSAVLLSWNPEKRQIRYFGIVQGEPGEKPHAYEAMADGSKKDWGEAPEEGSELQYVIDMNEK